MNVAGKSGASKWHSPMPNKTAEMTTGGVGVGTSSGSVRASIEGEPHDTPGSHAYQMVSQDYSGGRHEAYDSPLAQPAYSGHGKVEVGKSSAL